jgi:hypothetical protein
MRAIERSEMALIAQHEREQILHAVRLLERRPIHLCRDCEERSDEATQGPRHAAPGLLRCANKKQTVIILILLDEFRAEKER